MKSVNTSAQFNALKNKAIDAIATMQRLEKDLTIIDTEAAKLGITIENSASELNRMEQLSDICIENEYALLKQEEKAEIRTELKAGARQNWLGRKLTQLAAVVG